MEYMGYTGVPEVGPSWLLASQLGATHHPNVRCSTFTKCQLPVSERETVTRLFAPGAVHKLSSVTVKVRTTHFNGAR